MPIRSTAIAISAQTLRANPLRTLLSTLGVIMGVASLVAVLAVGDGVERFAREQIERTTDLQTVMVTPRTYDLIDGVRVPRTEWPRFTLQTLDSLRARVGAQATVSLSMTGSALVGETAQRRAAIVNGTGPEAEERLRLDYAAGTFFPTTAVAMHERVAVVSVALARTVATGASDDGVAAEALGKSVLLSGTPFQIVGVTRPPRGQEQLLFAIVPFSTLDVALVPTTEPRAPTLVVHSRRVEDVDSLRAAVTAWTRAAFPADQLADVAASTGLRLEQAQKGVIIFKVLMGSFAAISLLVGGIGIMNVLLAAVVERTREIGIRKAVGARQRDILAQFLSESVAICVAGAILGAAFGLAGAFGVTALMRAMAQVQLYAAFAWPTLVVAALTAVVVGLASGSYPALRAARLSPIEAIRHE